MSELITEVVGGEPCKCYRLGENIVRVPDICGGRPTFKYTRIELIGTFERLVSGETIAEIVEGYRGRVTRQAIDEVVRLITTENLEIETIQVQ